MSGSPVVVRGRSRLKIDGLGRPTTFNCGVRDCNYVLLLRRSEQVENNARIHREISFYLPFSGLDYTIELGLLEGARYELTEKVNGPT